MVFIGDVAQCVFQGDPGIVSVEVKTAARCAPNSGFEGLRLRQLSQLDMCEIVHSFSVRIHDNSSFQQFVHF